MGALDDLAAVLRARTGRKLYGTPFYEDEIAKREQEAQARGLGLEKSKFDLEAERQMLPGKMAAQEALAGYRGAQTENIGAKTAGLEYQNSPEYRTLQEDLKRTDLALKQARNQTEVELLGLRKGQIEANIRKADAQAAAAARGPVGRPGQGQQVIAGPDGSLVIVDKTTGQSRPVSAPGGEQLKARVPAGEMEKRAVFQNQLSDLDILEGLASGPAGKSIGPIAGRAADVERKIIGASPEVSDMFRVADNLATQLAQARSGAAVSEQEFQRLRGLVPNPRTPRATFDANLKAYRRELQNVLAARQGQPLPTSGGGVDPEVEKRLKALGY